MGHLTDRNHVECAVERPVAAAVEPVSDGFARGRGDRAGSGQGCEFCLGADSAMVGPGGETCGGADRTEALVF